MNVDLPAPLGPVSPYRYPGLNLTETLSNNVRDPYSFETSLTTIIGRFPATVVETKMTRLARLQVNYIVNHQDKRDLSATS